MPDRLISSDDHVDVTQDQVKANLAPKFHDAYDAAVETRVQIMTSLLEPLMIVVMGGAVAFIAISILMPLIQMSSFAG